MLITSKKYLHRDIRLAFNQTTGHHSLAKVTHKINHHHTLQPLGDLRGAGKPGAGAGVRGQPFLNAGARRAYSYPVSWKASEVAGVAVLMEKQ